MLTAPEKTINQVQIVYQDADLLVLNKPAGWLTLKIDGRIQPSLQDWVESQLQVKVAGRGGIVHRLDKETSGLILVAKSQTVFDQLQDQFKSRKVSKKYWALVRGRGIPSEGQILAPIGRLPQNKLQFGVVPGGKPADTSFRAIKELSIAGENYTLLEVAPKTGRTHQIRVHLKYLGYPIFGDAWYGGKKEKNRPMFLLAKAIEFRHPRTGQMIKLEIDLPQDLSKILV
ncbi:MAG: RluA family pseudouridine synthase [Patescibacteria group bacterium]